MAQSGKTGRRAACMNVMQPTNIALLAFMGIGGFYLVTEHRAHFFGVLPFFLLLTCPLMHLFMHHGHKHGRKVDGGGSDQASPLNEPPKPVEGIRS